MAEPKIVQVVIEQDGVLAIAKIPKGAERLLLSILSTNEDGRIKAIRLPEDVKMVPLSETVAVQMEEGMGGNE